MHYLALASCFCLVSYAVISEFLALGFTDINRLSRVRDDFGEDFTDLDSKPPILQHLSHPTHPPPSSHPHSPHPLNHLPHGAPHASPHTLALNASLSPHHSAQYSMSSVSTINGKYVMPISNIVENLIIKNNIERKVKC